tara:strand:+ start:14435 stop:16231 length:1797 start_codon:yes stop_codon:yes gene_type:complete
MAGKKTKPVRYASREFNDIKSQLVEYAKTYYPETYKDFNEASFGSLMLDTVAYIGDVLSFYVDYQANESFIDSSIETGNLLKLAKQFGYKNPQAFSATGKAAFYVEVPAQADGSQNTDLIPTLKEGTSLSSTTGTSLILISDVDFRKTDVEVVVAKTNTDGLPTSYAYKAYGDVITGVIETENLTVGSYQKFLKIELEANNITEIISVVDSEGNEYFEVPYLSHNVTLQPVRNPNYQGGEDVPYILREKLAARRFTVDVDENGKTSLQFGYGSENSIKNNEYPEPSTAAVQRYARNYYSDDSFDPSVLLKNDKFGVVPPSGDLVVTFRKNDGETINLPVNSVDSIDDAVISFPTNAFPASVNRQFIINSLDVENEEPVLGQVDNLSQEEIRVRAINAYSAQNRAVTKQDYISLIYRMPSKFGAVKRANIVQDKDSFKRNLNMYVLAEDTDGNLTTATSTVKENVKTWISQYKMINDTVDILDGQVVNFYIEYKVLGSLEYNQSEVLERCNTAVKNLFASKLLFGTPLYISEIFKTLNDLDSVVDTQDVEIKQRFGTQYGTYFFDIEGATTPDNRAIIVPENVIMELKFPDQDIIGVVV